MIKEKLNLITITDDYYQYQKLVKDTDFLFLHFDRATIRFESVSIFKCGYPNEEIFMHLDFYSDMRKHKMYEIQNSPWISELNNINKVHPRHSDLVFLNCKHYRILFEDEIFECIADNFEVVEK